MSESKSVSASASVGVSVSKLSTIRYKALIHQTHQAYFFSNGAMIVNNGPSSPLDCSSSHLVYSAGSSGA